MSIIDALAANIPDSILDQVYALQQRRLREIEEQGTPVTITSLAAHPAVKTIRDGQTWYFSPNSPVKAGAIIKDGSVVSGTYIITDIQEQAGRLAAQVMHLPDVCGFYSGESRSADFGISRVAFRATNWTNVPCALRGDRLTLPKDYTPGREDFLQVNGAYHTVKAVRQAGPIVEAVLQEY